MTDTTNENLAFESRGQASIELRGITIEGEVLDADALFLLSMILLEPEERHLLKAGDSDQAFAIIKQRQQAEVDREIASACQQKGLQGPTEEIRQSVVKKVNESLAKSIFFKVNNDGIVRVETAQRLREVFPSLPTNFVHYDEWIEQSTGQLHRNGRIRLNAEEILNLVISILSTLIKTPAEAKESETASETEVKAEVAVVPKPVLVSAGPMDDAQINAAIAALPPEVLERLQVKPEAI